MLTLINNSCFSKASSFVPILECDLGIGHQEEDGEEEVVRVRGRGLPCVEGEVAYSSEGGNPLDHEAVVDHVRPMAALPLLLHPLGEEGALFDAVVLTRGQGEAV